VSTPPSDIPPPPSSPPTPPPAAPQTQIVGQQTAPSTAVPHTPGLQPQGVGVAGQTNTLAVVSLAAGVGSFFAHIIPGIGGFTVALVAVITGYMARNQIKQTGEQGMGMATAGMIIGIVNIALTVLVVLIVLIMIFIFGIAMLGIAASHSSG